MATAYPRETTPLTLLEVNGPASNRLRYDYEQSQCPEQTDQYNEQHIGHQPFTDGYPGSDAGERSGTNPLGDPVVFSAYLLGQVANNARYAANFNLDADRAFGYLCWDWIRVDAMAANPRGQPYPKPVVAPEGANGKDGADPWTPPQPQPFGQVPPPQYQPPVQLHYPGRTCGPPPIG